MGAGLGAGDRGRRKLDRTAHWSGRYIHDVDHAAAHIHAKAPGPEVSDWEGKGQEEKERVGGLGGHRQWSRWGHAVGGRAVSGGAGRLTFGDHLVEQPL